MHRISQKERFSVQAADQNCKVKSHTRCTGLLHRMFLFMWLKCLPDKVTFSSAREKWEGTWTVRFAQGLPGRKLAEISHQVTDAEPGARRFTGVRGADAFLSRSYAVNQHKHGYTLCFQSPKNEQNDVLFYFCIILYIMFESSSSIKKNIIINYYMKFPISDAKMYLVTRTSLNTL